LKKSEKGFSQQNKIMESFDIKEACKKLGYINNLDPKEQAKLFLDRADLLRSNNRLPDELHDIMNFTHLLSCVIHKSDSFDRLYWINVVHELEILTENKEKYGHLFPDYFEQK
jgi:hypothetical protein